MKTKTTARLLSILLCIVMMMGLLPTTALAAGTKLEKPQNVKLQGTMLSWDAVANADFYGVTLYHPNYQYSIGSWQINGTNFNLYKYLKDGETYGATVIACSNGSYQISNPAEIPLTTCTNAGVPIYRDVNVINGTSSASTAYPGMSVRLEAKPAPEGMVFDRWELSGGSFNIGYHDTNTVVYVQTWCDNDIRARATYKFTENVTSAFTVQPQGGAALLGEYFDVTYGMNFTPQGTVKVQVEGNTPGSFTDLKQGTINSASVKEDSAVTKTFRIMASDGTRNIYSDEFVVSWEDGPRFTNQPLGGTVDHNVDFVATYALNFTPFSCRVERYNDYLGQWVELSSASATQATINSYDFNTSSIYRIKALIEGGGEVYSDEFTVTWSDAVSKFIQQPVGGTVGFDEEFSFTFAINFTPTSNIAIQRYRSGWDDWTTLGYCSSMTAGYISGYSTDTTHRYRLEAYDNGNAIYSNEFTVTWEEAEVLLTGWQLIEGTWYYYDDANQTVKGWLNLGGTWYYFNNQGAMQTGWQFVGSSWYYFAEGGNMVTGWQYINNTWYYFGPSGNMLTGWQYLGSSWYYFAEGGNMVTGWQYIGSSWYYFNAGGNMATGWLLLGNTWYYLAEGGAMLTGWQYLGGNWYYFNAGGAWVA